MKKLLSTAAALATFTLAAGPNADRPDATHAWAVHDDNRPNPPIVAADEDSVPSDALVLLDGTQASVDAHWQDAKGQPTKWVLREDRLFYSVKGSGMVYAKDKMSDFQLHVEFKIPEDPGEGHGNTGVYVGGWYELQVLHSNAEMMAKRYPHAPWKNANYADGQIGAVYGQQPPIVTAYRSPGAWQVYDVIFHAARWNGDTLVEPATMTAFLNGLLIHDNITLEGPTWYCKRTKHDKACEPTLCPVVALQDHGVPVPYRLIWARAIPPRHANTVHGGPDFNPADAAKLKAELAAKTLKLAHETDKPEAKLVWLWESYCYEKNDAVKAEIDAYTPVYQKRVEAFAADIGADEKTELSNMRGFLNMGVRNGFLDKDDALLKAVNEAMKRAQSKERKF